MSIADTLAANVGRYLDKTWDWNAFPSNDGYPELERAQMRYIGAGGSPKVDDASTLKPGAFTCSLIFQEHGRRAAVHHHKIEELFFVHSGQLTMTWQFGDETFDFIAGPGDAVLNPTSRPHGFRNDGTEDCVMQIMVATAAPMHPTYTDHPAEHAVSPLRPAPKERHAEYLAEIETYLVRGAQTRGHLVRVDGGECTSAPYVMAKEHGGLVMPSHFTYAVDTLTRGAATPAYTLDVEEAFMSIDGVLDIEFIGDDGSFATKRLGKRDLALVPAGVKHRLRNADAAVARFGAIVGSKDAGPFGWQPALSGAHAG